MVTGCRPRHGAGGWSRRGCLAAAAGLALVRPGRAAAPARLAVLDWAILDAVLALGGTVAAVAEPDGYCRQTPGPALPPETVDLGLRDQPNLELLQRLAPDLILLPSWQRVDLPRLARIAPVFSVAAYGSVAPLAEAKAALLAVGARLGREAEARRALAATERELREIRARLASRQGASVQIVSLLDQSHAWVFAAGSLFHDVLARLGLVNAWSRHRDAVVTIGLEQLARHPDAWIVCLRPTHPPLLAEVAASRLWSSLPASRHGRVALLPPLLAFGGLATARRFAGELGAALTGRTSLG